MSEFVERNMRPHFVYRLFDAGDRLLYIGCTREVQTRLYHLLHVCNIGKKPTGDLLTIGVARHESQEYPDRATALEAERAAIRDEDPLLNTQSKRKATA